MSRGGGKMVSNALAWFGANSMIVYCMHFMVILIDPNTRLNVHDWYLWLLVDFSMIIPMSYLCTKMPLARKVFQIK